MVWLVGAGPGDPGLLTVRGHELLRNAEVVLHDALVSPAILELVPDGALLVDVGKRAGKHKAEQAAIGQQLIDHARSGKRVVRLKGGDPLVFGRGAEEMLQLREAGVPYEVVPGVSIAAAGPAMAGIPVTHRELAGAFMVVTGHDAATGRRPVSWHALAGTDHTLVVLMGLKRLGDIAARLIAAGRDPSTPVAVVQHASLPTQEVVLGTLEDISERVEAAGLSAPAITVVGPVAALHEVLSWR